MADLILELYSEELPVSDQIDAESNFCSFFCASLRKHCLSFESCKVFSGPCRIVIYLTGVPTHIWEDAQTIKGPKISASSQAVQGFCNKNGIEESFLKIKDEYYFYDKPAAQRESVDILAFVIPQTLSGYVWNHSMRWGESSCLWPRPLRNILCLFDDKTLNFTYHELRSSNVTFGHKFLSSQKSETSLMHLEIKVNNWKEYVGALKNNSVILDQKERIQSIKAQSLKLLQEHSLREEVCTDLLVEVTCNVELPFVMLGKIPKVYMSLPDEIITTVMKVHQKYFPTYYVNGSLAPYFLFVSNCDPNENIKAGNERVLKARLADAYFLYQKDLEVSIEERYEQLSRIVFHEKLGSIKDKASRLEKFTKIFDLSQELQKKFTIAARFCKCDLAGEIVSDLPTLQGHIGYYYALNSGFDDEVALAIREHYLPSGIKDELPKTSLGLGLSLIDRTDSLVGLYLAKERSTGNKDPYGLRRLALGIIRILSSDGLFFKISLENLLRESARLYQVEELSAKSLIQEILSFIKSRHKNLLKVDFDSRVVDAVTESCLYDVCSAYRKAIVVQNFVNSATYEFIAQAFKRIFNLVNQHLKTDDYSEPTFSVCPALLRERFGDLYEKELNREEVLQIFKALNSYDKSTNGQDWSACLANLNLLCVSANHFIDSVRVSECQLYTVMLSAVLERFNNVIAFEHLNG